MKKILLLLFMVIPFVSWGQTDKKYLEPIPVKDGKITFDFEIKAPSLSEKEIYDALYKWAEQRFVPDEKLKARIVYTDEPNGIIIVAGEEYLVFSTSFLSLDRTRIYYQLKIKCQAGLAKFEMARIKYWYDEARNGGERYDAENWISDKMALNKKRTKLAPICGKFRRKTIDLEEELMKSAQAKVGEYAVTKISPNSVPDNGLKSNNTATSSATAVVANASAPTDNEKIQLTNDEIIASANRITISSGDDEQVEIGKECWGGFGKLFNKDVTFCLIETQKTLANMLLAQNDAYSIKFYIQGNNEAALTIRCKKISQQKIDGTEANKMNPKNNASKTYNLYVGEVE